MKKTPAKKHAVSEVRHENRMDAYLVMAHGGKELTVIVTYDLSEALRQAREEDVVKEALQRDGGIMVMPLRD